MSRLEELEKAVEEAIRCALAADAAWAADADAAEAYGVYDSDAKWAAYEAYSKAMQELKDYKKEYGYE